MRPLAWRWVSDSCIARSVSYRNRAPIQALMSSGLCQRCSASSYVGASMNGPRGANAASGASELGSAACGTALQPLSAANVVNVANSHAHDVKNDRRAPSGAVRRKLPQKTGEDEEDEE